ncbi:MAG TPA: DUF4157 domain-containing protein [Longimicrobium sp.]|nr:DUF4157 domain-containing protein [Longimicrobium sp.]
MARDTAGSAPPGRAFSGIPLTANPALKSWPLIDIHAAEPRQQPSAQAPVTKLRSDAPPRLASELAAGLSEPQVNTPDGRDEQEADRIVEQVMRMPEPRPAHVQQEHVRTTDGGGRVAPRSIYAVLRSPGQPLDPSTRAFMEPRLGHDFSRVRVHADALADQATVDLGARAFAFGPDIGFRRGAFDPASINGRALLAHELIHTLQQGADPVNHRVQRQHLVPGREFHGLDPTSNPAQGATERMKLLVKQGPGQKKLGASDYEAIKKTYFELVDKGPAHYMEAIHYLIDKYGIDASHALMSYDASIKGAYAITEGRAGDALIPVRFGPPCFNKYGDFGAISRAIAHELLHTKQKSVSQISGHDEREFLAYYDTLTRKDMPEVTDKATLKLFVAKALSYYAALSAENQAKYAGMKAVIDGIKAGLDGSKIKIKT